MTCGKTFAAAASISVLVSIANAELVIMEKTTSNANILFI
jgi:hypothetical protein